MVAIDNLTDARNHIAILELRCVRLEGLLRAYRHTITLTSFAERIRNEALEEAAKVAEAYEPECESCPRGATAAIRFRQTIEPIETPIEKPKGGRE